MDLFLVMKYIVPARRLNKTVRTMRLSVFLCVGTVLSVSANADSHSQTTAVSSDVKEIIVSMGNNLQESFKVTGAVTDERGESMPGVNVVVKGNMSGVVTDTNGQYSITVPNEHSVLVFSFIGCVTQEAVVSDRNRIDIVLAEDTKRLDEVVVVGYGTQSRREITGSVTNVTTKDFNQGLNRNAADMLQGKVSGLVVNSGSGDVTASSTLRLRGISTLQNDQGPFIVIDGIPAIDMSTVAPQDIESISVLKDASAAAIYGSRSAGGVILITTKKGQASKPVVTYNGAVGFGLLANKPNLMTAEQWRQYTSTTPGKDGSAFDMGANTDWFDEITRTAIQQDHNLSLSGGGSNHNYRGSVTYMQRDGIARDNYMNRYNIRLQFTQYALNNRLKFDLTSVTTVSDYQPSYTRNFLLAYNMLPVVPVKNEDGLWYEKRDYDKGNPVRNQQENVREYKTNNTYLTGSVNLTVMDGLDTKVLLTKARDSEDYSEYNSIGSEAGYSSGGSAVRSESLADKSLLEWTANYTKQIKDHKISALAGYSWEQEVLSAHRAANQVFITDKLQANDLASGQGLSQGDVESSKEENRLISFYGRLNYSFKNRYMLTATIRQDGSSKFGPNNKWGTFPSVSAAWNVAEEGFMAGVKWLDDLKLRAGYGIMGNQSGLSPYRSLLLYSLSGTYYNSGAWLPAYKISQNANPNLKWERTAMLNIGMDFSLFDSRLSGRIEWYNKQTSDMLYTYNVPTPPNLYSTMMANVGDMENKGIELDISGDIFRTKDFTWTSSLNISRNRNKVKRLSNDLYTTDRIYTGGVFFRGGGANTQVIEEGYPIGQFFTYVCEGLDENGRYVFKDLDDDGSISEINDYDYVGSAQPDFVYGLQNSFRYKKVDFSFFLRGTYGNDLISIPRVTSAQSGFLPGANALDDPLTYTLKDAPVVSSLYVEDGSFIRLDNMSLGYNLDYLNGIRVYLTVQNLFVITKYKGIDPEVDISRNNGLAPGIEEREFYPKARTFSVGVNINF